MPDRDVQTIQDLIWYQYAKIVTRSAFKTGDGKAAKKEHYGFIKKTFLDLKTGRKSWSDILREDWQLVEGERQCTYCGGQEDLHREHIVPRSLRIRPECQSCDTIQGIHNQVWACGPCNLRKGDHGLYEFYRQQHAGDRKYYDLIPPLIEKKYLKTIFNCHRCAGTLDCGSLVGGPELTVLDIDAILRAS